MFSPVLKVTRVKSRSYDSFLCLQFLKEWMFVHGSYLFFFFCNVMASLLKTLDHEQSTLISEADKILLTDVKVYFLGHRQH